MTQYSVTGMSCAACSARVEKAVSAVPGVTSCAVSLLTNSMGVDGTAAPADIVLRGLKDYVEWRPTAGTTVDIYQYVPPARPDAERPGATVHHLYLRRTETLTETVTW